MRQSLNCWDMSPVQIAATTSQLCNNLVLFEQVQYWRNNRDIAKKLVFFKYERLKKSNKILNGKIASI